MDYPISVPSIGLVGGKFVDEDSVSGTPGSLIPALWGNAVTDEILNVILAAGLTPDESNNTQLITAIRLLNKQPVLLNDTGVVNAYAAVNAPALAALPPKGFVQRVVIANANTGASTYAPDGLAAKPIYGLGLQPLQGGELAAGVAVLMYLVQAEVNGGNGAWIVIESLGGASQVPPATKSQHAIQLQQMAAVVGGARNASMIVATASATATFTADEVAVKSALGGSAWLLPNFNKPINLATTGAGGMDTGPAPANGFVAIYACFNPLLPLSSTNPMLMGKDATSVKATEVYSGVFMPEGYTASALVSIVPINASLQVKACTQFNREINTAYQSIFSTTTPATTPTLVSASAVVPKNALSVTLSIAVTESSAGSGVGFSVSGSSGQVSVITAQATVSGQTSSSSAIGKVLLQSQQQLYYFMLNLSSVSANIGAYGYEF